MSAFGNICDQCQFHDRCNCALPDKNLTVECKNLFGNRDLHKCVFSKNCKFANTPGGLLVPATKLAETIVIKNLAPKKALESLEYDLRKMKSVIDCEAHGKGPVCPLHPEGWEQIVATFLIDFAHQAAVEDVGSFSKEVSFHLILVHLKQLNGKPALLGPEDVWPKRCRPDNFIWSLKSHLLPAIDEVRGNRHSMYSGHLHHLLDKVFAALESFERYVREVAMNI